MNLDLSFIVFIYLFLNLNLEDKVFILSVLRTGNSIKSINMFNNNISMRAHQIAVIFRTVLFLAAKDHHHFCRLNFHLFERYLLGYFLGLKVWK